MDCANVRRLLSAYHDAELPGERRRAVRLHLRSCEACSSRLRGFQDLAILAEQFNELSSPASLWEALAPKFRIACQTAAPAPRKEAPAASGRCAGPRPTFKPSLEGLEDRQALSELAGGCAIAIAPCQSFAQASMISLHELCAPTRSYLGVSRGDAASAVGDFGHSAYL